MALQQLIENSNLAIQGVCLQEINHLIERKGEGMYEKSEGAQRM